MYITYKNATDIVQSIHLHDSTIQKFEIDVRQHEIRIDMLSMKHDRHYILIYDNVANAIIEGTSLWGEDFEVMEFGIESNETIVNEIRNRMSMSTYPSSSRLNDVDLFEFVHSYIFLNSGDCIRIICQRIEYTETIIEI